MLWSPDLSWHLWATLVLIPSTAAGFTAQVQGHVLGLCRGLGDLIFHTCLKFLISGWGGQAPKLAILAILEPPQKQGSDGTKAPPGSQSSPYITDILRSFPGRPANRCAWCLCWEPLTALPALCEELFPLPAHRALAACSRL